MKPLEQRPEHLGGGENRCHSDPAALSYLVKKYGFMTMADIGCGRGCMVREALGQGLTAVGVEGDTWHLPKFWKGLKILEHDYVNGPCSELGLVDLVWSVEFLEHVEEKYMDNYMKDFQKAFYVICTHAPPGKGGNHHVNCQTESYWIGRFGHWGFTLCMEDTMEIRARSTMRKNFIRQHGLVFKNENRTRTF